MEDESRKVKDDQVPSMEEVHEVIPRQVSCERATYIGGKVVLFLRRRLDQSQRASRLIVTLSRLICLVDQNLQQNGFYSKLNQ